MALPQVVTKTYGRRRSRQADVSRAEQTFDEVFRGTSRPPARATATAEKWGSASFKRISHATRTLPQRRLSPSSHGDDPFSFDSDDDNIVKKSRKENLSQKIATDTAIKQTVDVKDGRYVVNRECTVREKPRRKHMKSSDTEEQQPASRDDVSGTQLSVDNMKRSQTAVRAKLKNFDSAAGERNGLSAYSTATVRLSGKGDSRETDGTKCRSNGIKSAGSSDRNECSPDRRSTRSHSESPSKTTERMKVFVNNFSQLLSSQWHSPASHSSQSSSDVSSESGHLPDSVAGKSNRPESPLKKQVSLRHSKRVQQNIDDDDDEGTLLTVFPLPRKSGALQSATLLHQASNTSKTLSGTRSSDTTNYGSSLFTKTNSKTLTDCSPHKSTSGLGSKKNETVSINLRQSKSRRRKTSVDSATDGSPDNEPNSSATTAAATSVSTNTSTRRLLKGSRKVLHFYYSLWIYNAF